MTSDDDAPGEQDPFLLYYYGRLPSADEIRALQSRFGMTHVPTYLVRRQIVQAATFYFAHLNPQKLTAREKRYSDVITKTNALLCSLGKGVDFEMLNVEPPGLRSMLYQMRESAARELAVIQPKIERGKKQRRETRKGTRSFICALADMLNWFDAPPMSVYTPGHLHHSFMMYF
jgi:hypothetical protein